MAGQWLDFTALETFFWCALISGQNSKLAGGGMDGEEERCLKNYDELFNCT